MKNDPKADNKAGIGEAPGDLAALDAKQVASLLLAGHTLYAQGRVEDAKKIFEGLAALDGKNPYVHGVLGAIYQKEEKYDIAIARYSMALGIYPKDVNSLTNRGEIFLKIGKFIEAASDFKKAIDLDPQMKNPAANRARLLVVLTTEALKLAEEKGADAVQDARRRLEQQLSVK